MKILYCRYNWFTVEPVGTTYTLHLVFSPCCKDSPSSLRPRRGWRWVASGPPGPDDWSPPGTDTNIQKYCVQSNEYAELICTLKTLQNKYKLSTDKYHSLRGKAHSSSKFSIQYLRFKKLKNDLCFSLRTLIFWICPNKKSTLQMGQRVNPKVILGPCHRTFNTFLENISY